MKNLHKSRLKPFKAIVASINWEHYLIYAIVIWLKLQVNIMFVGEILKADNIPLEPLDDTQTIIATWCQQYSTYNNELSFSSSARRVLLDSGQLYFRDAAIHCLPRPYTSQLQAGLFRWLLPKSHRLSLTFRQETHNHCCHSVDETWLVTFGKTIIHLPRIFHFSSLMKLMAHRVRSSVRWNQLAKIAPGYNRFSSPSFTRRSVDICIIFISVI